MYMHAGESGKRKRIRILWNIRLSWCIVCFYDQLENEKNKKKNGGYPISCLCKNAFPGSL